MLPGLFSPLPYKLVTQFTFKSNFNAEKCHMSYYARYIGRGGCGTGQQIQHLKTTVQQDTSG